MPVSKSPLRYPGGKTQLASYVAHLLELNKISGTYIEPFAGGFGVGLDLLENNLIKKVVMNDLDPSIFAIWFFILNYPEDFIAKMMDTDVTVGEWVNQQIIYKKTHHDPFSFDNAFSSFFLNRTNISGIIKGGPIGGMEQKSKYLINCRFNKKSLVKKIRKISSLKSRICLTHADVLDFIDNELKNYSSQNTFIFFDPPYFSQGRNLYLSFVSKDEHIFLAKRVIKLNQYKWIMTYDINPLILKLYKPFVQSFMYKLNYSANRKRRASEYLFANNNTNVDSYKKIRLLKL